MGKRDRVNYSFYTVILLRWIFQSQFNFWFYLIVCIEITCIGICDFELIRPILALLTK